MLFEKLANHRKDLRQNATEVKYIYIYLNCLFGFDIRRKFVYIAICLCVKKLH